MDSDPVAILGPDGRIANRLDRYEARPQQLEMARAVAAAIADESHLLVEAGTGVGKSFAYLVPAILAAANRSGTGAPEKRKTLIVSTHTISLQEQLVGRDIPFLNAVLPVEFSAVLAKGRSNYVSLRRLRGAVSRAPATLIKSEEHAELEALEHWAHTTNDGSRADLGFTPSWSVWDDVASDHGNCLGRKCPTYKQCFYYSARRRVWNADVLIVNHALFFSDLALRRQGASVLPDYDTVILDEAHTVSGVAREHMGLTLSSGRIEYTLNRLFNDRTNRGLLVHHGLTDAQQIATNLRISVREFFHTLREWQQQRGNNNGRVTRPPAVENGVSPELERLAETISRHAARIEDEGEQAELQAGANRCGLLAATLHGWLTQEIPDAVYWLESTGRGQQRVELHSAPIDVGPVLRDELFNQTRSVVMTSATLAVRDDFAFARRELGLTQTRELRLGSPFDFLRQVQLFLPGPATPDPGADPAGYEEYAAERVAEHVLATQGRAFVLFTSYRMLRNCADRLSARFAEHGLQLFCQGAGLPRSQMLERFRNDPHSVLFGTDSFWQGVDVPGESLQNVIITRLPFSVPDHPLTEARLERIASTGGRPFVDFQVPEAVIKLKQGFGRLIRTATDSGRVVLLDPRVRTKQYGRLFLESLPQCSVVIDEPGDTSGPR